MDTRALAEKLIDSLLVAVPESPVRVTDEVRGPVLEVQVGTGWIEVGEAEWRSWTGPRMINGKEHHGPVYAFGSPDGSLPFTGRRVCRCAACQEHVAPELRPN